MSRNDVFLFRLLISLFDELQFVSESAVDYSPSPSTN